MPAKSEELVLTEEQRTAVDAIRQGFNVTLRAVPGAGKSTVAFHVVQQYSGVAYILTYSARMKDEWRDRCREEGLRAQAHSFDSFAKQIFCVPGDMKSETTSDYLARGEPMIDQGIDLLIIDEAQDLAPLHFRLLKRYAHIASKALQLVVIGDERQTVYTFFLNADNVASPRFLMHAETEMTDVADNTRHWRHLRLTESFRMSPEIVCFVNRFWSLQGDAMIRSARPSSNHDAVHYHCANMWNTKWAATEIAKYIRRFGQENVMILSPFTADRKGATTCTTQTNGILNKLKQLFPDIHMQNSSERGYGNVRVYTYSTCKGLEAQCVIMLGADSFASFITQCQRFVAMTRAKDMLVLFHDKSNATMRDETTFNDIPLPAQVFVKDAIDVKYTKPKPKPASVTDIIGSGTMPTLKACIDKAVWTTVSHPSIALHIAMPTFSLTKHQSYGPDVSDMYGMAITLMVEQRRRPPRLYANIFNSILVGGSTETFLDEVVDMVPNGADIAEAVRNHYRRLRRSDNEETRAVVRSQLLQQGLPERPSEEDFVAFAKSLFREGDPARDRVIGRSDFAVKFPIERRVALNAAVPLDAQAWTAAQAIEAACAVLSFRGQHHRLCQIQHYDWVSDDTVNVMVERLSSVVGDWTHAELPIHVPFEAPMSAGRPSPVTGVDGRVDFLCTNRIVECKVTQKLEVVDKAQLLLYAMMTDTLKIPHTLVNVRTAEVIVMDASLVEACLPQICVEQLAGQHAPILLETPQSMETC